MELSELSSFQEASLFTSHLEWVAGWSASDYLWGDIDMPQG